MTLETSRSIVWTVCWSWSMAVLVAMGPPRTVNEILTFGHAPTNCQASDQALVQGASEDVLPGRRPGRLQARRVRQRPAPGRRALQHRAEDGDVRARPRAAGGRSALAGGRAPERRPPALRAQFPLRQDVLAGLQERHPAERSELRRGDTRVVGRPAPLGDAEHAIHEFRRLGRRAESVAPRTSLRKTLDTARNGS